MMTLGILFEFGYRVYSFAIDIAKSGTHFAIFIAIIMIIERYLIKAPSVEFSTHSICSFRCCNGDDIIISV